MLFRLCRFCYVNGKINFKKTKWKIELHKDLID